MSEYAYAKNLAEVLYKKYYAKDAPNWKPLPDTIGVLTQIDNMTSGLTNLNSLRDICHGRSVSAGWWLDPLTNEPYFDARWAVPLKIALIHSELSEALEAHRKDSSDAHLPHRRGVEVELADALIRIFDLAGALQIDLDGAVREKMDYNLTRKDHKLEERRAGGKSY